MGHSDLVKEFEKQYQRSIQDPEGFWAEQGKIVDWIKPYSKIKDVSFKKEDLHIKWFHDGTLNACYNCLDRHLENNADTPALIWEGDDENNKKTLTYRELYKLTCRIANVLKQKGVRKGDRVTIYMPLIVEAVASMLACARIGAIHSVVFGGFSPESLAHRIEDCQSTFLITADATSRRGKTIDLKAHVDEALALDLSRDIQEVLVVRHLNNNVVMKEGRDYWLSDLIQEVPAECECEEMSAEDPLFILYTSGSTGSPKGVLHTTGGYMVYATLSHKVIFDYKPGEIYWCTADIGWITGHTYLVYGPLSNGASCVLFEGVPTYPDFSRYWKIVDRYKVNTFYTSPTAIRSLMKEGDAPVLQTSRKSLRLLGSVGEPINKDAWEWYHDVVGEGRCPIVDTWWQTETGGILLTPLPYKDHQKPGSVSHAFYGVQPALVNEDGKILEGEAEGALVMTDSWPGQMRTVYRNHKRFYETYFATYPGLYFSGDGARRDADGDYWITGRVDDVIKVSGHRLGTAEIEDAIDSHEKVAEAAVVGCAHEVTGQAVYAYVTLEINEEPTKELADELRDLVSKKIGSLSKPAYIQWSDDLPKTRSGKIMRRILRKIADRKFEELGDTSTLSNPDVVLDLIMSRAKAISYS